MEFSDELSARFEIAWWESYHTRNWSKLEQDIIDLRKAQFGITINSECAKYFADAGKEYIDFKKCLAAKDEEGVSAHLNEAERLMLKHYAGIKTKLSGSE